jgi:hypothetical protein
MAGRREGKVMVRSCRVYLNDLNWISCFGSVRHFVLRLQGSRERIPML